MPGPAAALAGRLAREAEAVCRHYLSNGRRSGRYWLVGDVANNPGRSLFVRLTGPETGPGAAGHWTDAATGQHGDLLDLIGLACDLGSLGEAIAEAHRFLGGAAAASVPRTQRDAAPPGSVEAARRLFAAAHPITGTLAETYLRGRGITARLSPGPLRFHPSCFYRAEDGEEGASLQTWPALLAGVTDLSGHITGVQRTWLARDGSAKAPLATPRRAMGHLLGHGVRFGKPDTVLAVGEGIETVLAVRSALPGLPCVAALSANHLAVLRLPEGLRRLYVARDADPAGIRAAESIAAQAGIEGVDVWLFVPVQGDFNDDLQVNGLEALTARLRAQLAPADLESGFSHGTSRD